MPISQPILMKRAFLLGLLTVAALTVPLSGVARAIPITVNSTADAPDSNLGDGVCKTSSGTCTLRAAVMQADVAIGQSTITVPAGTYTLTISGANENAAATG